VTGPYSAFLTGFTAGYFRGDRLEQAISRIGEELHSQYLLSFSPAVREEGAFHEIEVKIRDRTDVTVRTRPGYWLSN